MEKAMKREQHHVVPHPDGWAVRRSGRNEPSHVFPTKREAVNVARTLSRKQGTELVIHRKDGTIQRRGGHGIPYSSTQLEGEEDRSRRFDLHPGAIVVSSDFDEPLPDEFWLGEG